MVCTRIGGRDDLQTTIYCGSVYKRRCEPGRAGTGYRGRPARSPTRCCGRPGGRRRSRRQAALPAAGGVSGGRRRFRRQAAFPTAGGVSGGRRRFRRQAALPAAGGASCAQEKGRPPGMGGRPLARNGRQRPNFSLMISTISAPMRFCASTVEAPICGVADTRGCCSSAALFGGSSANTSSPAP